jgi:hypothetical protein
MTLMEKMLHSSEHSNEVGNQIPDDPACKTGAMGTARQSRSFNMASMWQPCVWCYGNKRQQDKDREKWKIGHNHDRNFWAEEERCKKELRVHSRQLQEAKEWSRRDRNYVDKLKNILCYPETSIFLRLALENLPISIVFIDFADQARKLQTEFNMVLGQLTQA